jgi:PAS domain S-box-containing protein
MQAQRNAINESASLVITDEKGDIQFTNNNFCITTGYSNKELIGKNPRILNSGYHDDAFFRDLWKTIKSGKVWRGEIQNKRKDNSYYWLDTAIAPIFNRSNNQKGYLAIRFDCTKRKEYEAELEKLNKSNKNLIYSVAHDLKGPFLNFQSLLSLNNLCLLTKEEGEKIINQLIRDSNYSLKLLEELLMAGRMENPNYVLLKKKVNLNKFLKKLIRQFDEQAKNRHLKIKSDFQENIPFIEINEDKFNRAIRNLLSNALKFTPEKGQILIKTKLKSNNIVLISIIDSGIGIPKENQKYIFDRFTKYSNPGLNGEKSSGLGLWIVKRIIELHEGEISVKSEVNKGTTFTVFLPVK